MGVCFRPAQQTPAALSKLLCLCSVWFFGPTFAFLFWFYSLRRKLQAPL